MINIPPRLAQCPKRRVSNDSKGYFVEHLTVRTAPDLARKTVRARKVPSQLFSDGCIRLRFPYE